LWIRPNILRRGTVIDGVDGMPLENSIAVVVSWHVCGPTCPTRVSWVSKTSSNRIGSRPTPNPSATRRPA